MPTDILNTPIRFISKRLGLFSSLPVDLFHFTVQQLAPNPLRLREGESHTVRAYLRHWLHRHHYPTSRGNY